MESAPTNLRHLLPEGRGHMQQRCAWCGGTTPNDERELKTYSVIACSGPYCTTGNNAYYICGECEEEGRVRGIVGRAARRILSKQPAARHAEYLRAKQRKLAEGAKEG